MGVLIDTNRRPAIKLDIDTLMIQSAVDAALAAYLQIITELGAGTVVYASKIGDHQFKDIDDVDDSDIFQITADDADGGVLQKTSQITDGNIWEIEATGTISGATVTVDINEFEIDLASLTLDDGAANAISLIGYYFRGFSITPTAVGLSAIYGSYITMPEAGEYAIEEGINIYAHKGDASQNCVNLDSGRGINADISADRAFSEFANRMTQAATNSSAGDFDLDQPVDSGCLLLGLSHTAITSVGAKTDPDAFAATALLIDIDGITNEANTKLDASPRAIDITYNLAETLGELRMAATDILRITATIPDGLSSAGAFQFDMAELNADAIVLNDANITFNALNIDASGLTNTSSALATLINLIMPNDSNMDTGIVITADTTTANSQQILSTTRDINGTVAGAVALANYAHTLGQAVNHTGGDFIVTQPAATAGIMELVMAHTVSLDTAAPDLFSSTALSINIDALVDTSANADLDVAARAIDIDYTLTETLGVLRMADTDIFRITTSIPNGLTSAGAFQFDMLELNADAVILNDANITFHGLYIDATALTLTACAAYHGIEVDIPLDVGVAYERSAIFASDQVHWAKLADGSMGVNATGINDTMYYKCEDFDEEVAGVTLEAGVRADEWTGGGTNYDAADITYIAGAGGVLQLQTDGADDDSEGAYWIGTNVLVNSNPIIEFRVQVDGVGASDVSFMVGLTETVAIVDIRNIIGISDDYIAVGIDSDEANPAYLRAFTNDTGAAPLIHILGANSVALSTWTTIRIDLTDNDQPRIYVNLTGGAITAGDEIAAADVGATATIQAGIAMFPFIFIQSVDAGVSTATMLVDYVKIWQERS